MLQAVEATLFGFRKLQANFNLVGPLLKPLQNDTVISGAQLPPDIGYR